MLLLFFFFLMIRRTPRSTQGRSSAASDVYKRQIQQALASLLVEFGEHIVQDQDRGVVGDAVEYLEPVSYTHLRAHETVLDLVCRLLLEKKNYHMNSKSNISDVNAGLASY